MPKGKNAEPLHETDIELLRRWIAEGAKDDSPVGSVSGYTMDNPPTYAMPPVVTSMDFSPDGTSLAVTGFHEALIHKADGSGLLARLVGLSERIESVCFSPGWQEARDNRWAARKNGGGADLGYPDQEARIVQGGHLRYAIRGLLVSGR